MKNNCWKIMMAALLMAAVLLGMANAEELSFQAEGHRFTVNIPEPYLAYTVELGAESPMMRMSGADAAEMDAYMAALDCAVCCLDSKNMHQMWLTIKDRSVGLGRAPEGGSLPADVLDAYYEGLGLIRGAFTVETIDGREFHLFANGRSIYSGGINYFISTFMGHYEISLRWESGTGSRTEEDIAVLKEIIASVRMVP